MRASAASDERVQVEAHGARSPAGARRGCRPPRRGDRWAPGGSRGREHDDPVTEGPQPLVERPVEVLRPLGRVAAEIRPPDVVDAERVPRQQERVRDQERRAARRVTRVPKETSGQDLEPADPARARRPRGPRRAGRHPQVAQARVVAHAGIAGERRARQTRGRPGGACRRPPGDGALCDRGAAGRRRGPGGDPPRRRSRRPPPRTTGTRA